MNLSVQCDHLCNCCVRQHGTGENDFVHAIAMAEDESVVIVGSELENHAFKATKLDTNGTLLWQWEVRE